jgi:hypothetical protein
MILMAIAVSTALDQRIDEAARYIPIEQLALSPQCGFASVAAGNLLSEDDQWRKLDLIVERRTDRAADIDRVVGPAERLGGLGEDDRVRRHGLGR